ncbi:DNA modification methylase [Mesorhizobium shangrilense]|uniref:Methyltransferase n=1 Tax=Mesorhizobium shangrilense TaxID=460060 RepID=A0ABV2DGY8_9HYPH
MKLEIKYIHPSHLKPSEYTARHHNRKQKRKLKALIEKNGIVRPIVIEAGNKIVDGHAIYEVALELGLQEVPTTSVEHLPVSEIRALRIALNRLPEQAVWDKKALKRELGYFVEIGYDLDLIGFETVDVESLLEIDTTSPSDIEELDSRMLSRLAVTRLGDVWELGGAGKVHRIVCGSSLDTAVTQLLFGEKTAAACVTDPPFNLPANSISGLGKVAHRDFAMAAGEMSDAEFEVFLASTLRTVLAHVGRGGVSFLYIDWRHVDVLMMTAKRLGCEILNLAVWVKTNAGMGSLYRSQHELVVVLKRQGEPHRNNVELGKHGRSRSNVWQYRGVNVFGPERHLLQEHPTVKPAAMLADAIRDTTQPGDTVFDPFLGSGSTMIAAERTHRLCYGIEIEPTFVDLSIRRWQAETGRDAVRTRDGMTFDEAAEIAEAERMVGDAEEGEKP